MSFNIVICLCVALIFVLSVFFAGMVYCVNLGIKLAEKGAQPVKVFPEIKPKVKKSKEQIAKEEEYERRMNAINNFHGYGSEGIE